MVDEITIEAALSPVNDAQYNNGGTNVVTRWDSSTSNVWIYIVYSDATALRIARSINGGSTFVEQTLQATTGMVGPSVWYDRWTPGDTTGTILHIAACDPSTETLKYFSWDLASNTVGSTTNITIHTFTTISGAAASADGGTTICKGANGSLYTAAKATTTSGWAVRQSTDNGGNWSDITAQGSNVNTAMNQVNDVLILIPCSITDDIMAVEFDTSAQILQYQIYDDSANSWAAPIIIQQTFNSQTSVVFPSLFNVTLDKTTSNIYLVYGVISTASAGNILFRKFTISSGTWSNPVFLFRESTTGVEATNLFELGSCAIERDQTNGMLVAFYTMGNNLSDMALFIKTSSDDGQTWSDGLKPLITIDDFRYLACPFVMNDIEEGWYCVWTNDDLDDLLGLAAEQFGTTAVGVIKYSLVTGNVKDNNGNNIENAEVNMFKVESEQRTGGNPFSYQGRNLTNSSGNYKILINTLRLDNPKYQAIVEYDRVKQHIFKNAPTLTTLSTGTIFANKFSNLISGDKIIGVTLINGPLSNSNLRFKAYDDSSGSPNSLLGEVIVNSNKGGTASGKFPTEITVPSDGIVWIAFETSLNIDVFQNTGLASGTTKTVAHTYGTGPDPFGTPTNQTYRIWVGIFGKAKVDATIGEFID